MTSKPAKLSPRRRTRWSKAQIRAARRVPLPELLAHKGFDLYRDGPNGDYRLPRYPGIVVKDCFWLCEDSSQAGNAIDFFITVLAMSFSEAMAELCDHSEPS
jgi:hypothetical protein